MGEKGGKLLNIFELYATIGLKDDGFKKGINEATGAGKTFTTSIKGIIGTVAGLKVVQLGFEAIKKSVTAAMDRIDTIEQFNRTMTVLTGSSSAASAAMDKVLESVTGTAYGLTQAASGVQNFVTSGMDLSTATDTVATYADAVSFYGSGTNEALEMVMDALNKTYTNGKVYQTNLNSLMLQGIPALEIYADATGKSVEEVQESFRSGEVDAKEFITVLTNALEEGTARFPSISGAAQEAGASWKGTFDNMQADVTKATTNILQDIDKNLVSGGLPTMREGLRNTSKAFASFLEGAGKALTGVIKIAAPVAVTLSKNLDMVAVAAMGVTASFATYKGIKVWSNAMASSRIVIEAVRKAQDAYTASVTKNLGVKSTSIAAEQFQTVVIGKGSMVRATALAAEKLNTKATGENTVARAASVGVVGLQTAVVNTLTTSTSVQSAVVGVAKVSWKALNATMLANPAIAVAAAIGAAAVAVGGLVVALSKVDTGFKQYVSAAEESRAETDAIISSSQELIDSYDKREMAQAVSINNAESEAKVQEDLASKIFDLQKKIENGAIADERLGAAKRQLSGYVADLNGRMEGLNLTYDEEANRLGQSEYYIRKVIAGRKEYAKAMAEQARQSSILDEIIEREDALWLIEQKLKNIQKDREKIVAASNATEEQSMVTKNDVHNAMHGLYVQEEELLAQQAELQEQLSDSNAIYDENAERIAAASSEVAVYSDEVLALSDQWGLSTEEIKAAADASGLTIEEWGKTQQDAADDAAAKLESYTDVATNMFDTINVNSGISVGQMTQNLLENQKVIRGWSDNLVTLGNRGVNQGILEVLKDAGPESAEYVANLVNASDQELAELSTAFESGTTEATDTLRKVLGLPEVTESGADMVDNVAEAALKNEALVDASENIVIQAKAAMAAQVITSNFDDIGTQMTNGITNGITAGKLGVISAMVGVITAAHTAAKVADGQNSPSKWWAGFAKNSMAGWANGIADNTQKVVKEMVEATEKVENAASMPLTSSDFGLSMTSTAPLRPVPTSNNTTSVTNHNSWNVEGVMSQEMFDWLFHEFNKIQGLHNTLGN